MNINNLKVDLSGLVLAVLFTVSNSYGQIYHPTTWVNDPHCLNPNYGLTGADSDSPSFTNNGVQRGTLFANSPIGSTLKLANSGDTLSFTGQVTIAGNINADGFLQFRLGLYYQGEIRGDTNWLGYMVGNVAGSDGSASHCLFVRNNPNSGNYGAGLSSNAVRPECEDTSFAPKWGVGTYDFELAVTLLPDNAHKIAWKLTGTPPLEYKQSGVFTNTLARTIPPAFDQVGFLGGAAIFQSASTNDSITLKNITVSLTHAGETH